MKFVKNKIILILLMVIACTALVQAGSHDSPNVKAVLLNQDPDPVDAGDVVEVRFKIENKGAVTLEDFVIEILPEYPFSLYSGTSTRNVGKLLSQTGADAVIVDYKLRVDEDAVEGDNEIKLRYTYGEAGKWWIIEEDLMIDVEVEEVNFQLGSLLTEPAELVADTDDAKLSVELQNIGEEKAQNVIMNINLPEGFKPSYGYSDRANLGTIDAESSKTGDFYVDVAENLKEGEYSATLKIEYKEEDDNDEEYKSLHIPLKIPIKAAPLFEIIEAKTEPEFVRVGDKVNLKLKIKNTGTKKAESVSVKAFKEASQPFEFEEKSDFVGKLEPGETGEAVLTFTVESDAAPKKHILDIEIRTINEEDVLVYEKKVPITINNGEATRRIIGIGIVVVIVVAGLIIYYQWRKRSKSRKEQKG